MVATPGVNDVDAVAVIHDTLLLTPQLVLAPWAETLMVCGAGVPLPGMELKTRLVGEIGSNVTWF